MWLKLAAIALLILLYWAARRSRSGCGFFVERCDTQKQPPRRLNTEGKNT